MPASDFEYERTYEYIGSKTGVKIPSAIEGAKVVKIGYEAFYYQDDIALVVIPDSVTEIGNSAFFHCEGLTSITIPNSVIKIAYNAFLGCTAEITYKGKTYTSDGGYYGELYNAINGT